MIGFCVYSGYTFKAGSYIYVNAPTIGRSEWHPFSIIQVPGETPTAAFYAEAVSSRGTGGRTMLSAIDHDAFLVLPLAVQTHGHPRFSYMFIPNLSIVSGRGRNEWKRNTPRERFGSRSRHNVACSLKGPSSRLQLTREGGGATVFLELLVNMIREALYMLYLSPRT